MPLGGFCGAACKNVFFRLSLTGHHAVQLSDLVQRTEAKPELDSRIGLQLQRIAIADAGVSFHIRKSRNIQPKRSRNLSRRKFFE